MGTMSLNEIILKKLNIIEVEGGNVIHLVKSSYENFHGFGEAYFSIINPKFIKGWKKHGRMFMNLSVIKGKVKFVFCLDDQKKFREEIIDSNDYANISVPPNVWFAFEGISSSPSIILNISNIEHDANEVERLDLSDIKYSWD